MTQVFRFALAGLSSNKMRSALTMLGILIGVASVIVLLAVGQGSSASVSSSISSLGSNSITVLHTQGSAAASSSTSTSTSFAEPKNLTVQDSEAIAKLDGVASASPVVSATETLSNGGTSDSSVSVTGTYPSYLSAENDTVSQGAAFTTQQVNNAAHVVVLGSEAATDLFGAGNAVGQSVLVNGIPFTVTGVLASKGSSGLGSADNTAIAPLTTVQDTLTGFGTLNNIVVVAKSASQVNTVQSEVTSLLYQRHNEDASDADFNVFNASSILSTASSTSHTLTVLLGAVAAISLLVGGLGVMNIMLVTVTERTREIGIRKAIGATPGVILAQFLMEATLLSVIGGILGVLIGIIGTRFKIVGVTPVLVGYSIPLSLGFSVIIGVVFGGLPARRASAMRPVDALRYE